MTAVVLRGDAAHLPLPDGSVDLIVTSPPYWGLRAYSDGGEVYDGQIGSERSPGEYVAALLNCTREWMRVLKPEGSLFVNLGDKYSQPGKGERNMQGVGGGITHKVGVTQVNRSARDFSYDGTPGKSLLGLPWRYALGCVDQLGLILRAEVIWDKPNGLPESVTDRVRRSHEQIFHFTKQPRYYAAVDEIREKYAPGTAKRYAAGYNPDREAYAAGGPTNNGALRHDGGGPNATNPLGKLPGSVWEIPSAPLVVPAHLGIDHFAAYPPELCRRIILGWSPSGICSVCGEGRRPVVARGRRFPVEDFADRKRPVGKPVGPIDRGEGSQWLTGAVHGVSGQEWNRHKAQHPDRITGDTCACHKAFAPTRSAVVLDPFGGTGTTALVADVLGRTGITVDRSADYCRLARWRTRDPGERARALGVPKPLPVPEGQRSLFDELEAS